MDEELSNCGISEWVSYSSVHDQPKPPIHGDLPSSSRKGAFLLPSRCVLEATVWPKKVQLIFCTVGFRPIIWHTTWHTKAQKRAPRRSPEPPRMLLSIRAVLL